MLLHASIEVSPSERRGTTRRTLRLQSVATSRSRAAKWNIQIHDLSTTGFLMEANAPFGLGEKINLQVAETMADAEVVWTSGRFVGCRFDTSLSKSQLSAALLKSRPKGRSKTAVEDSLGDIRKRVAGAADDLDAIERQLTALATTSNVASQSVVEDRERSLAYNEKKPFPLYVRGWFILLFSVLLWALLLSALRLL